MQETLARLRGIALGIKVSRRLRQLLIFRFALQLLGCRPFNLRRQGMDALVHFRKQGFDALQDGCGGAVALFQSGDAGGMLRVEGVTRGINYGSNKVRFTNMVTVGSRVRARQKLTAVEPRAGGMQLTNEVTIEIDGQQRPACVAETISLIYK